ncbi:MAG: hypothetical protein V4634_01240 [Pseudomonadota bacterium]
MLIHAGASSAGCFAIQLAKYLEACVATTCASNRDWTKRLSTDVALDYKQADFATRLHN